MANILALFDLDGTLVTMWPTHERVYASMFAELYNVPNANFRKYYTPGGTHEENVRVTLNAMGYSDEFIEAKIDRVTPTIEKYYSLYSKGAEVKVCKGVKPLLEKSKAEGIVTGIVTGNVRLTYNMLLEKAGLDGYFSFVVGAEDSISREGRLLEGIKVAERIGGRKYDPKHVYFFDDSQGSIAISRRLGINSVAVASGDVPFEILKESKPDYLLKDLSDTKAVLQILLSRSTTKRKGVSL